MNNPKSPQDNPARPNLFHYATSELSQDAFLAWLMAWAHETHAKVDPDLHQVAVRFVRELLEDPEAPNQFTNYKINSVTVERQWEKIDVHAIVNNEYFILIEDKTGTKDHEGQLKGYVKVVKDKKGFEDSNIKKIYLKMEEQSDLKTMLDASYRHLDRETMLRCLRPYAALPSPKNDILLDFLKNLEAIDEDYNSFKESKLGNWSARAWQGFFAHLQQELGAGCNWEYLPNRAGGVIGLWWRPIPGFPVFLQLNQARLVFRMDVIKSDTSRAEQRKTYQKQILESKTEMNLTYFGQTTKGSPTLGLAKWFEWRKEDDDGKAKKAYHDYRIPTPEGKIDLPQTVKRIKEIKNFIGGLRSKE